MNKSRIAAFLVIMLAIISLAHLAIYEAVMFSWPGISGALHTILHWAVIALPLMFVSSIFLNSKFNNIFTRTLYKFIAAWTGSLAVLLIAAIATTIVSVIFPVTTAVNLGKIFLVFAVLASIYGLINAASIKIVALEVQLPNLPESWRGKKIAFVSDLHLGQIFGSNFAKRVTKKINSFQPEIVLIGGDLYDGGEVDRYAIIEPLRELRSQHGTYFITGNHDGFTRPETMKDIAAITTLGIKVLKDELVNLAGLQFVGADYKSTVDPVQFANILQNIKVNKAAPSILIKHVPAHINIAEAAGLSMQLSGHTHRAQQWPFSYMTSRIYKGFDYGLKKSGPMQVYTSSGVGSWGPPQRIGTQSEIVVITLR